MVSRDKEVNIKPKEHFWMKKKPFFQKSVTLRKINIFPWDFFKTISTRSENSISGVFQRCSATKKKLWAIKVVKQIHKILKKSQNREKKYEKVKSLFLWLTTLMVHNLFLVVEHLWKTPEMEFSDRVDIVLKKSHRKIWFFRKVTDFWKCTCESNFFGPNGTC